MSRCESQLRHFLKTLTTELSFPKQSIINFLAMNPLNTNEFSRIHAESWQYYITNLHHYREMAMLIFIGLTKNVNGMVENAIDFVQGMIMSRLIMLIFNERLEFEGDRVLLYLEPTVELTVVKAMENGKEQDILAMLQRVNGKQHTFNEIGFLLEMTFIKKIQKYLEDTSLQEFNQILKSFLHYKKISRLFSNENSLHFRYIVILRQDQDKQQTYYLQFINGGKLIKLKEPNTVNALPNWVQQAFWKTPRTLNFQDFKSTSVAKVHNFLSEIQVFASSPLIQQFDCYTKDEIFLTIFQQFLMGLNISSQPYKFHWQKMKSSLELIRQITDNQNPCYRPTITQQLNNTLGDGKNEQSILQKSAL